MRLIKALRETLIERQRPIITNYELFLILYNLYRDGQFRGEPLSVKVPRPTAHQLSYYGGKLYAERQLKADADFTGTAHRVTDVPDGQAEELTALVDPFCYLSHMSAMQRYGLTTRSPEALTLSTPLNWKELAAQRERDDFGEALDEDAFLVRLTPITLPEHVRKRRVEVHTTKRTPVVKPIRESVARIASVGDTFVQTLDRPELCGGMAHVLDVWNEHARTFVDEIITAIGKAPEKLIKVRAGYILSERMGIADTRIEDWVRFAQRGGSQRLDPSQPYVSNHSEKWMISLNVPFAESAA
jgi:predicted transcriptional regulator of viral defense system